MSASSIQEKASLFGCFAEQSPPQILNNNSASTETKKQKEQESALQSVCQLAISLLSHHHK